MRLEEALRVTQAFVADAHDGVEFELPASVNALSADVFLVSGRVKNKGVLRLLRRTGRGVESGRIDSTVPGRVRWLRPIAPLAWEVIFLTRNPAGTRSRLERAELRCPDGLQRIDACRLSRRTTGAWLPEAARVAYGQDGAVLVAASGRIAIHGGAAAPRPIVAFPLALSRGEVRLAAVRDRGLALSSQSHGEGTLVLVVTTPGGQRAVSVPLPSCIVRDLRVDDRLLILMSCDGPGKEGDHLVDCPAGLLLQGNRELFLTECRVQELPRLVTAARMLFGDDWAPGPEIHRPPVGCDGAQVVSAGGWTWLQRGGQAAVMLPADSVLACDWTRGQVVGYRAGRLNWLIVPSALGTAP